MRWIRWDFIMKAKCRGGMGLGDIQNFNFAMLAKWLWRFKMYLNQLWVSVVGAIHKGNGISNLSVVPLKKSIPGFWNDIGSVEASLAKIGINLKDSLIVDGENWKWRSGPNGAFSVKQVRTDIEWAKMVADSDNLIFGWNSSAPPKVNYLCCRALIGKVASKVGLVRRGVPLADSLCPRCGIYDEDPDHIFVNCLWSRSIWSNVLVWMRISFPIDISNIGEFLSFIQIQPGDKKWKKVVHTVFLATIWRIWKARNEMVFEGRFIPTNRTVELVKEDAFFWIRFSVEAVGA
ncbi:uncharacterized protein LOC110913395 [Helianthus annuus]|uniref:uncharacterized protein LOC110913395 n=1 Tax=Helianthus annuus TaxID=4232 RepID=UPI000B8F7303|nr:uncharacterized protein LOC110913395 [Helianthus annuus]